MGAFRKFVSGYALIISLLIAPPIFERFFAMLYLFQGEKVILWIASLLLMSISLYSFFGRLRPTWAYFVLFNLLFLISVELGARSAVKLFFPNKEVSLARRAAWTYDELRKLTGHPFLQYNGLPSTTDNQGLGSSITSALSVVTLPTPSPHELLALPLSARRQLPMATPLCWKNTSMPELRLNPTDSK
jgi:hypothetical protein